MLKARCFWKKKDGYFLLFFGQAVLKYTAVSKAPGEIQAEISFSIYLTIGGKVRCARIDSFSISFVVQPATLQVFHRATSSLQPAPLAVLEISNLSIFCLQPSWLTLGRARQEC